MVEPHPAVASASAAERSRAVALAETLGLPMSGAPGANAGLLLMVTPDRLELRDNSPRRKGEAPPGPVFIDADALARLASQQPNYRQPVARALAVDPLRRELGRPVHILDATAGLLHDSALLLSLGCRVSACERNPILAALIDDARARGLFTSIPSPSPPVGEGGPPQAGRERGGPMGQFRFLPTDALGALTTLARENDPPDIVYFDPMHPARRGERESTALVRKELRILRAVVGDDADSSQTLRGLLVAGRAAGVRRVVVKMPLRANPLIAAPAPVHSHRAKAVRYDVFHPVSA